MTNHDSQLTPGWLAGRLIDPEGRPQANGTVSWMGWIDDEQTTVTAVSAADGRFLLGPLRASPMTVIWCEAPGCARLRLGGEQTQGLPVFPDTTNELGDIPLSRECAMIGRVVDADDRPIAGARIMVEPWFNQLARTINRNGPEIEARSRADGTFRIGSLPRGRLQVTVAVAGQLLVHRHETLALGTPVLDLGTVAFRNERTRVRGLVTEDEGAPIPGVRVHANDDKEVFALTDADGRFDFMARAAKLEFVTVAREGYHGYSVSSDEADEVHCLTMQRVHYLDGRVRDARTDRPLPIQDVNICEVLRREVDGTVSYAG